MALSVLDVFVGIVALSMSLVAVLARRLLCGLDALGVHDRCRRGLGALPLRFLSAARKALRTKNHSLLRRNLRSW
jgi:hypothetical protein